MGGVRFLVMEYVDGIDLDRLVREGGRLPVGLSCEYVRQAALGLHYAFERGVLHRDVKPANLFLATRGIVDVGPASSRPTPGRLEAGPTQTTTGVVKLLDLGLARATAARGDEDGAAILSGTPDYMAPEVAHDSRSRDVRSDLYSLGCTFFYLLTGQVPFPGGTWTEKLLRHQYEAPPALRTLVPEVPPAVAAIVERLMAKDPADRYPTPGHLAAVLQEWLVRPGPAADARSPRTPTVSAATPLPGVLPDLSSALAATQPQTGTVTSQQKEPAGTARNRWQRQFLSWLLMIFLGVLTGLFAARTARQGPLHASNHAEDSLPAASTVDPFVLERSGTTYRSLTEAVAAAAEGDTIAIHGDDPLSAEVLDIHGKAMILRAAPGAHPCLDFRQPTTRWAALIAADRALTLEGLELRGPAGTTPFVCSQGAALRLLNCRMSAPGRSSVVVCRGSPQVELRGCEICAGSLALCLEVDGPRCEAVLADNRIEVEDAGAAAVSLWRTEQKPGQHGGPRAGEQRHPRRPDAGLARSDRGSHRTGPGQSLHLSGCSAEPDGLREVSRLAADRDVAGQEQFLSCCRGMVADGWAGRRDWETGGLGGALERMKDEKDTIGFILHPLELQTSFSLFSAGKLCSR